MPGPIGDDPSQIQKENLRYRPPDSKENIRYRPPQFKGDPYGTPQGSGRGDPDENRDIGTTPDADLGTDESSSNISAVRINRASPPELTESVINYSGYGMPIPVHFGRVRWTCPWCITPVATSVHLWGGFCIGWGEIDHIESIIVNGVERFTNLTVAFHGITQTSPNVDLRVTPYFGLPTQTPDPNYVTLIPGYNDDGVKTMGGETRGVAYLVMRFGPGTIEGDPQVEVIIRGLKTVLPSNGYASAPVWNDNPAAALWAYSESKLFGRGLPVDPASVEVIENENNEDVSGAKRHTLNVSIASRVSVLEWQNVIAREYADCYVRRAVNWGMNYRLEFASARARPPDMVITEDDIVYQGQRPSFRASGKGTRNVPNRVLVGFTKTRTGADPWGTNYAIIDQDKAAVEAGTIRLTREIVNLPGIHTHEEASLRGTERLNGWQLENRSGQLTMRARGVKLQVGDVIDLTVLLRGYSSFEARVTGTSWTGINRWEVFWHTYAAAKYSNTPVPDPNFQIGDLGDPTDVPQLTSAITAREDIGPDAGRIVSRILVSFTAESWPFAAGYEVLFTGLSQSLTVDIGQGAENSVLQAFSPDISNLAIRRRGSVVTVSVRIRSSIPGVFGPTKTTTVTVFGKWAPPPDPSFQSTEIDIETGDLELIVSPVQDIGGPVQYEFRFSPDQTVGWADAIRAHDGLWPSNVFRSGAVGLELSGAVAVFCKAVDSSGVYSVTAARTVIYIPTQTRIAISTNVWPEGMFADGWQQINIIGAGEFMVTNLDRTMVDRYGAGSTWQFTADAVYENLDHTGVQSTFRLQGDTGSVTYSAEAMRNASWQGDVDETEEPSPQPALEIATLVDSGAGTFVATDVNYVHRPMDGFRFRVDAETAFFPNDYLAWIKAPVTHIARVQTLLQSGTVSTNINQSPHTVVFPVPYTAIPIVRAPITTVSGSGRSITMSIDSISATQVVFVSDAASGGNNQTFSFTWESEGV